jgi:hypothetical protein
MLATPPPTAPDGLWVALHGDLTMTLSLAAGEISKTYERNSAISGPDKKLPGKFVPGNLPSLVAGTRNHLDLLLSA